MPKFTSVDPAANQLLPVRAFSEKYPAFSEGGLRWLIFNAKDRPGVQGNGLDSALVRIGRRVLIDEARFFEWVAAQQK